MNSPHIILVNNAVAEAWIESKNNGKKVSDLNLLENKRRE